MEDEYKILRHINIDEKIWRTGQYCEGCVFQGYSKGRQDAGSGGRGDVPY